MLGKQREINKAEIERLFGSRSVIYRYAMSYLEKKKESKYKAFQEKYIEWQEAYKDIYGNAMTENLFLKHSYFALLLKALLITELSINNNLDLEEAYMDFLKNDLIALQIFEFNLFYWIDFNIKVFSRIYDEVEDVRYAREDLFELIYQEIFVPDTRHKIGEYYTPDYLVKKMLDDTYQIGLMVLDPSCGSGSFLIEIISRILNSKDTNELKLKAIKNVYGFDINPLAIITAKANIILLFLEYFEAGELPTIHIYLQDSLSVDNQSEHMLINVNEIRNSFDLIIGNPPWLTYKDLNTKSYQNRILDLASELEIKPASQYITHIELASIFFYAIPIRFLKPKGTIFFVMTKSVLNGDHCHNFRSFSIFSQNIEIWEFPKSYIFNVPHICLKAEYLGKGNDLKIEQRYPIKAKLFDHKLNIKEETEYSTLKVDKEGAGLLLLKRDVNILSKVSKSEYKSKFYQGATLVPRTLVFFQEERRDDDFLVISSDPDVITRAKTNWKHYFQNKKIEKEFSYQSFLNKDLIPFFLTKKRKVFLPVNDDLEYEEDYLKQSPKAWNFYNELNEIYKRKKKQTSEINTLFENLNYWNKLTKQKNTKDFLVIYNASGSNLKAAVIPNHKRRLIIGSENYYYPTDSKEEAYYLTGILNSPILSRNMKLIKSSRHIHKRPFTFPIPIYDKNDEHHEEIVRLAVKCESISVDLFLKNPKINSEKVRVIMTQKLQFLNMLVKRVVFNSEK